MRRLVEGTQASMANGTTLHSSGYNGGGDDFDTNMVIILAALLCSLLAALALNSILRCVRRLFFDSSEDAAARLAATGLKKGALRRIPVTVYVAGAGIPATECPICLGEFSDGEKVRVLPKCHHGFHVACIDTWLASHVSCPTCRGSLVERKGVKEAVTIREEGEGGQREEVVVVVHEVANL